MYEYKNMNTPLTVIARGIQISICIYTLIRKKSFPLDYLDCMNSTSILAVTPLPPSQAAQ